MKPRCVEGIPTHAEWDRVDVLPYSESFFCLPFFFFLADFEDDFSLGAACVSGPSGLVSLFGFTFCLPSAPAGFCIPFLEVGLLSGSVCPLTPCFLGFASGEAFGLSGFVPCLCFAR